MTPGQADRPVSLFSCHNVRKRGSSFSFIITFLTNEDVKPAGIECVHSSGRPGNVAAVRKLLERDCRFTVVKISKETGIVGTVHTIRRYHQKFRKISARWVPCLQTINRLNSLCTVAWIPGIKNCLFVE